MFERFTEHARLVVVNAQDEARKLGHPHIGSEHELLGLLREPETIAGRALAAAGLTVDDVRERVVAILGRRDEGTSGQMPFTPRAKAVLEGGLVEAQQLGHSEVGPEHLLLSLMQRADGNGVRVLHEAGVQPDAVRQTVMEILSLQPPPLPDRGPPEGAAPRFSVAPDRQARELLRAAAARALADGRDTYGPDDVRAVLAAEGD
jgi:ATP-dependent Clp protease ATP-binding subunit ClpC